jgi:hypothetical protein
MLMHPRLQQPITRSRRNAVCAACVRLRLRLRLRRGARQPVSDLRRLRRRRF